MPTSSGYSKLSGIYDMLGRIVFGGSLELSARHFLDEFHEIEELLILGGGTGKVLLDLDRIKFTGRVTYVDSSGGMIDKAKLRETSFEVVFVSEKFENVKMDTRFDAIHCAFFLDQFNENDLAEIIERMELMSSSQSLWIITDFVPPRSIFHQILLWSMYRFFRVSTNLKAEKLVDIFKLMETSGHNIKNDIYFYNGLIRSCLITSKTSIA